jgi:hypothetical protein
VYLLDAFRRGCAAFLLRDIIPCISVKEDTDEDRTNWVKAVSFAIVSGVLNKLAKKYPKDVDEFFSQAEQLAKEYTIQDLKDYPRDCIGDRQQRWIDKFKELPRVPMTKKSWKTGQFPPHKLDALYELENVCKILIKIAPQIDNASFQKNDLRKAFPFLSDEDIEASIDEIKWGSKIEDVALAITAKKFNSTEEYLKRRLSGAKKMARELDEALKYKDPT